MPCQAGAQRVHNEILNRWKGRVYNAGCYVPGAKLDDGRTPSPHAKGEAIDVGIHPPYRGRSSTGQEIFLFLHANRARLGITQLIYDRQIWSASRPGSIRSYTVNPHADHIHVQFNPTAARNPNLSIGGASAPAPVEEEDQLYYLLQGDTSPNIWLTNGFVVKRLIVDPPELDAIKKSGVLRGRNDVIKWPQTWVDRIPTP